MRFVVLALVAVALTVWLLWPSSEAAPSGAGPSLDSGLHEWISAHPKRPADETLAEWILHRFDELGRLIPGDTADATRPERERRYQESLERARRDFGEFSEEWRERRLDGRVPELLSRALSQFSVETMVQRSYGQDYVAEVRVLLDLPTPSPRALP